MHQCYLMRSQCDICICAVVRRCTKGGYSNLVNIDISSVCIRQQQEKFPKLKWYLMDATNMIFGDERFPVVIDKSLIDTLLCGSDR